jgi:translation initiation factor 1
MKKNDWKERLNIVYSTNPDFAYSTDEKEENETLPKQQQKLRVSIEKNHRGGKTVTLVKNFIGTEADMKELGKLLKTKCGVGGSAKDGEIVIQGDMRDKVLNLLLAEGYNAKRGN